MPVYFERKAKRSGGSIVVSIPPEILRALKIKESDVLLLYVEDDKLVVEKYGESENEA